MSGIVSHRKLAPVEQRIPEDRLASGDMLAAPGGDKLADPGGAVMEGDGDRPTDDTSSILIAVCTLRESANIGEMLAALRTAVPAADLLVVDDSSEDGTASIANQFADLDGRTRVIVRTDKGLGGAIRLAMQHAVDEDYQLFVNLDADFSHDPAEVPRLIEAAMAEDEIDVVIGSRYSGGGQIVGWPLHRRLMSRMVNRLATRRLNLDIADCSGSMRCYRVASLRRMGLKQLSSEGYSVLEEVLVTMRRTIGARFLEVPITFTDRQAGQSKLTPSEAWRSIKKIWNLGGSPV